MFLGLTGALFYATQLMKARRTHISPFALSQINVTMQQTQYSIRIRTTGQTSMKSECLKYSKELEWWRFNAMSEALDLFVANQIS